MKMYKFTFYNHSNMHLPFLFRYNAMTKRSQRNKTKAERTAVQNVFDNVAMTKDAAAPAAAPTPSTSADKS